LALGSLGTQRPAFEATLRALLGGWFSLGQARVRQNQTDQAARSRLGVAELEQKQQFYCLKGLLVESTGNKSKINEFLGFIDENNSKLLHGGKLREGKVV
jgi:hypothetical protein